MGPLEVIAGTAEAAFATDEQERIVVWNGAAERLLGQSAASVLGRPCHQVLCGLDVFGNRFCSEECPLTRMVQHGEPLHRFEIDLRDASGKAFRAAFSVVAIPGPRPGRFSLIHMFRPAGHDAPSDEHLLVETPGSPLTSSGPGSPLTGREEEVLRLMTEGIGTQEIADALFISKATVRTHIQNVLRKLEVHSKLEAVSLALRNHLI